MQFKIKGFDPITAWITALALTGGIFATLRWMGTTSSEEATLEAKRRLLRIEKELKNFSLEKSNFRFKLNAEGESDSSTLDNKQAIETLENWGYSGNLAPWYWPHLNDKFKPCGDKTNQSPIDITGAKIDETLKTLKFYYKHGITYLTYHHQTVQGEIERGSYIEWDGERFDLVRVLFHTPSEHLVNGLPWELEIQLEHKSVSGSLIMVSNLIKLGKNSESLERIVENLPSVKDEINKISQFNWENIFPIKKTYWSYIGSTTYPPCFKNVRWIIFTDQVPMSKESIDKFVLLQRNNVRPTAPIANGRLYRSTR